MSALATTGPEIFGLANLVRGLGILACLYAAWTQTRIRSWRPLRFVIAGIWMVIAAGEIIIMTGRLWAGPGVIAPSILVLAVAQSSLVRLRHER